MYEVEILNFSGEGYMPLVSYNGWRVAIINYKESLEIECFDSMEMHTETDEVFIPIKGKSTLYAGDSIRKIEMEEGKIYNVRKNVWHHICMSKDACVAVVENEDTGKKNTVYKKIKKNKGV